MSTIPSFSDYTPPGVLVREEVRPLLNVAGLAQTVVGIVGPSKGYRTTTESLSLPGTTTILLAHEGIDTATIEVRSSTGILYIEDTDYEITVIAGEAADGSEDTIEINRMTTGDIEDGQRVFVSYQFTDSEYYAPHRFQNYDEVQAYYGEGLDITDDTVQSPLSLAARVAMQNGAREVVLLAVEQSGSSVDRTDLGSAYNQLLATPEVTIVVPLPVGISGTDGDSGDAGGAADDLDNHVREATDNGMPRIGIFGYDRTISMTPTTISQDVQSKRTMVAYPNRLRYHNSRTNNTFEVSGYYLAAAYAGRFAGQQVQEPLTRKRVRGFAGIPSDLQQEMTISLMNSYSSGGVAVTEVDRSQRLIVRHGVSSDVSDLMTREINLVRASDALTLLLNNTMDDSGLIGSTIDEETANTVRSIALGALETAMDNGLIVNHRNLLVRQILGDPSVIEVKFEYQPAYPLNYIVVVYSVNVQTGEVDTATEVAA